MDSGASHHLISFDALTPQEHKTVRKAKYTIPLQTANDVVHCKYEADVWVEDLQITVVAFVLETDVPPLLSVGKLNKVGFAFHQIDEDSSYLENRNSGAIHYCTCVHEWHLYVQLQQLTK